MKTATFLLMTLMSLTINAQDDVLTDYPKANVDFDAFEALMKEVKPYRAERLISAADFVRMSKEKNVVILDTRSKEKYDEKHIKGAIHLNFSDFTQTNLLALIPDPNTTILIYCNNNFEDDEVYFPTKSYQPQLLKIEQERKEKELTLALNIPTFINLYGYGYRNIYELDQLIAPFQNLIQFEGTAVMQRELGQ